MITELLRELKERKIDLDGLVVTPERLAELLQLVKNPTISYNIAKEVLVEMIDRGESAEAIVEKKGLKQISDTGEIEGMIEEVLAENPDAVQDLKEGKKKAFGFLVGQVMRKTEGKANPQMINKILKEKVGG